jgi:hypothetical protein
MTSTLLLGLVTSLLGVTIYLFHNGHVIDEFNITARLSNSSSEATIYLFHNGHVIEDFNLTARLSNLLVRSTHISIP